MDTWVNTVFWQIETFRIMEPGEYVWFTEIDEDFPEFHESVVPFALQRDHVLFRRPIEVIRPGFVGLYSINDLQDFAMYTYIAVDRMGENGQEPIVLDEAPTVLYRPLHCTMENSVVLSECSDATGSAFASAFSIWGPFDMEIEPLFTDFRVRLIVEKSLEFHRATKVCISLHAYGKFREEALYAENEPSGEAGKLP